MNGTCPGPTEDAQGLPVSRSAKVVVALYVATSVIVLLVLALTT